MKSKSGKTSHDFDTLCAADVMRRDIVTVRASDPIDEVERVIADAKISGVPVIGDTGRIIGILSTTDLVDRYADNAEPEDARFESSDEDGDETIVEYEGNRSRLCAADVMTPEVESIPSSTPLRDVARRMVEREIHRLMVVDDGKLVGLVSTLDVLRAVAG